MLSLFCACTMQAQEQKHSTFYYQRATLFEVLPTSKSDIVFLGNSITNGGEWAELLGNPHAKNRGISGDTTQGVLDRLSTVIKGKPAKIFLLIGTNDFARGKSMDEIVKNVEKIAAPPPTSGIPCRAVACDEALRAECVPRESEVQQVFWSYGP